MNRNSMIKVTIHAVLLSGFATAVILAAGCSRKDAKSKAGVEAAAVLVSPTDVVRVESRRLDAGVSFTGDLVPAQIVRVTAWFDGDLDDVKVREGLAVRKGQALAVYRPRDVKDKMAAAEAQLLAAQANLRAAENAERRARRLFDAGAASSSDLEVAESQRTAAQAALDNATAHRNSAHDDMERLDVPSPIDGWVSESLVHAGDHTAVGDPMFTLVDTRMLELEATVPSEALGKVQPGAPIRFTVDSYPGEEFEGEVSRVNPTTEPGTRQVKIYARLPNPEGRLVGGLFASGRVIYATKENAVAAPLEVLRKEGADQVVYRVHEGSAARIAIQTGIVDDAAGVIELIGSLAPGDSLLTGILPGLKDGVRIQILTGGAGASGGATNDNKAGGGATGR